MHITGGVGVGEGGRGQPDGQQAHNSPIMSGPAHLREAVRIKPPIVGPAT